MSKKEGGGAEKREPCLAGRGKEWVRVGARAGMGWEEKARPWSEAQSQAGGRENPDMEKGQGLPAGKSPPC